MKKKIQRLYFLLSFVMMWAFAGVAVAQMPEMPPLPMDPNVRYGKLDNGLTYYIRRNNLPENRAEFYIAQRVGSVLEEEEQRGLAHFLEHMAFNGTKNFPDKSMLDYLERQGVKFGTNVNAYTSIDETVYNLSDVPTTIPGLVDSCLLILHDWSGYISLEDKAIDDERGVIHEEWRTRSNAGLRMYENVVLPKMLPGNRYGERLPIGLMSVIDNFSYEALRAYYHKWYRPDLQAVMVVGDINVDEIEAKIKTLWQDIQTPADAAERVYYTVEDNVEPLVAVASDKEMTANLMVVNYKSDPLPDNLKLTQLGFVNDLVQNIIAEGINMRVGELAQKADAPFLQAGVDFGSFIVAKTKDAFSLSIIFKEGEWNKGLQAMVGVVKSVAEYGFTPSEVERIKADILSNYENYYNERDTRKNGQLVKEMTRHFLESEPMPGIELEYQMIQQIMPVLTVEMINQSCRQLITKENVAMYMMAQDKESNPIPTEAELLAAYQAAVAQPAVAYEEKLSGVELMTSLPKSGKIKKESTGAFGTTVWTLSNGAKVVYKQTDFKQDEIILTGYSAGGSKIVDPKENFVVRDMMGQIVSLGGIADFSTTDLPKVLAGKRAELHVNINRTHESLGGNCSPKDLETLLQLLYLNMTDLRYDEEAYAAWYKRIESSLLNSEKTPQYILSDSLSRTLYAGQPELYPTRSEDLKQLDYKRSFELACRRFDNAQDFTFYFIGNIQPDSLRPLVEQYIASLPKGRKAEKRPAEDEYTAGPVENRFEIPMQTPKTTVYNVFFAPMKWTLKDYLTMNMLYQIMNIVYTETVREQEGGTYGVQVFGSISHVNSSMRFLYAFDTGAEKCAHLEKVAFKGLQDMASAGPREVDFNKVRDFMLKKHAQDLKENRYWISRIINQDLYGIDEVTGYEETLKAITVDDVRKLAEKILASDRKQIVATGVPVEEKK